ncbi:MAG TPA: hypothetical protein VFJ96_08070 [Gemmatimonadaceae bacterium]|nr:hypothetical protein [Gemmatimonadaceae bacterium]
MNDRDIVRGTLGCHVCGTEYPVTDGVADFTLGQPVPAPSHGNDVASSTDEELALRAAALLDLAEPGGFALLTGAWSACAPSLTALTPRVHLLALDASTTIPSGGGISLARAHDTIPVRPHACRGIALDAAHTTPNLVATAVDALRPGGRLVAPASLLLPPGLTELARDEHHWVAAKASPPPVVRIRKK